MLVAEKGYFCNPLPVTWLNEFINTNLSSLWMRDHPNHNLQPTHACIHRHIHTHTLLFEHISAMLQEMSFNANDDITHTPAARDHHALHILLHEKVDLLDRTAVADSDSSFENVIYYNDDHVLSMTVHY